MSVAEELTFHLEDFDGPLELLLALVAKHKMDLHNIPILELIDQYTATVARADPDPEAASAFIEMAARLVEMKSYLLLPRSEEGERMKQEFTGQLIEYDQCRRMAALLRQKAEAAPVLCVRPWRWSSITPTTCTMRRRCWRITGPFFPAAPSCAGSLPSSSSSRWSQRPMVSVTSRVVYILRHLISGTAAKMSQLFSRQQTRSTNVATFLPAGAGARRPCKAGRRGRLTMQRGRIQRDKEKE